MSITTTNSYCQSPIWGASPFSSGGGSNGTNSLVDPNWGSLPSRQGQGNDMWGNRINNGSLQRLTQPRDVYGNILQTNALGNVLYDNQGMPLIDTAAMQTSSGFDLMTTPPPPPDDTVDVPIDGGVLILLLIATALGYKNRNKIVIQTK